MRLIICLPDFHLRLEFNVHACSFGAVSFGSRVLQHAPYQVVTSQLQHSVFKSFILGLLKD